MSKKKKHSKAFKKIKAGLEEAIVIAPYVSQIHQMYGRIFGLEMAMSDARELIKPLPGDQAKELVSRIDELLNEGSA
jgi:pyruvate/oxaloacetate carboxyltransferase